MGRARLDGIVWDEKISVRKRRWTGREDIGREETVSDKFGEQDKVWERLKFVIPLQ